MIGFAKVLQIILRRISAPKLSTFHFQLSTNSAERMNPFPTLSLVSLFFGTGKPVPYGVATCYLLIAICWRLVTGDWRLVTGIRHLATGD